jgi:hypothetical protein
LRSNMCRERKTFRAFIEAEMNEFRCRVQERENNRSSFLV